MKSIKHDCMYKNYFRNSKIISLMFLYYIYNLYINVYYLYIYIFLWTDFCGNQFILSRDHPFTYAKFSYVGMRIMV